MLRDMTHRFTFKIQLSFNKSSTFETILQDLFHHLPHFSFLLFWANRPFSFGQINFLLC